MPDKSESARINGAKSKGPVTPSGRARASQNALKHGLRAKQIVLPDENRGAWRELLNAYIHQFQPATPVEHALVETMAAAQWRMRRLLAMETSILDMDMFDRKDEEYVPQMTNLDRLARTFQQLANNQQVLHLLTRYESTLQRAGVYPWSREATGTRPLNSYTSCATAHPVTDPRAWVRLVIPRIRPPAHRPIRPPPQNFPLPGR